MIYKKVKISKLSTIKYSLKINKTKNIEIKYNPKIYIFNYGFKVWKSSKY